MADRDVRREQARKHLALMKGALAGDAEKSVSAAVVYEDGGVCFDVHDIELPEGVTLR